MCTTLKIDFVSDISCPWCIIGLQALEQALAQLGSEVSAQIRFQPYELNPTMPAEGQDIKEHIAEKYGSSPEQIESIHTTIRERGAELGFDFASGERRIYNTFDAHRLLHWAELEGKQLELKHALFKAYFTDLKNPADRSTLADVAQRVGLDRLRAEEVLASGQYAAEVRELEQLWITRGVSSVPTIIFNEQYAVSGGQPVDVFVGAIRQIIAAT